MGYQVKVSGPWCGRVDSWRLVDETIYSTEEEAFEAMARYEDDADEDAIRVDDEDRAQDTVFRVCAAKEAK